MGFHLLNAPTEHLRHNDEYFFARYGILVSKSTLKFARYTNEVSKISKRENSFSFVFFSCHARMAWQKCVLKKKQSFERRYFYLVF